MHIYLVLGSLFERRDDKMPPTGIKLYEFASFSNKKNDKRDRSPTGQM